MPPSARRRCAGTPTSPDDLASVDLEFEGKVVDVFHPEPAPQIGELFRNNAEWGMPVPGNPDKLAVGTEAVMPQAGVSYIPDGGDDSEDDSLQQPHVVIVGSHS